MAKGKKGRKGNRPETAQIVTSSPVEAAAARPQARFRPWDYLLINVFFWLFCFVQRHLAAWWIGEDVGLAFFFYTIASAFTIVSIFTFVHDLFYPELHDDEGGG